MLLAAITGSSDARETAMNDQTLKDLRAQLSHLPPTDRFFHLVSCWPYPHEFDDKPVSAAFLPSVSIKDLLGTTHIK